MEARDGGRRRYDSELHVLHVQSRWRLYSAWFQILRRDLTRSFLWRLRQPWTTFLRTISDVPFLWSS
ncbi:hypothetical protein TB1_027853 [Malus domestica]